MSSATGPPGGPRTRRDDLAVALVLRHAFTELGLRRVKAYAAVGNVASQRVLTANGLTERGVERLGTVIDTGRVDAVLFDVLAEEWAGQ